MHPTISLLTLGVDDLPRARAFYAALGWRESSASQADVAFLRGVACHLALWSRAALAADSGVERDTGGWGGIVPAHNVASREDVDAVLEEARAAGGSIVRAGAATEWGGYSGIFADPDGHRWEIAHNPAWPLDAVGLASLPE